MNTTWNDILLSPSGRGRGRILRDAEPVEAVEMSDASTGSATSMSALPPPNQQYVIPTARHEAGGIYKLTLYN